jgi:hypothetical protein
VHRRHRAQVGDDGVDIRIGDAAILAERHGRSEQCAVGSLASADGDLDLRIGPLADAGLRIGRDVGRDRGEEIFFEWRSTGQRLVHDRPVRPVRPHGRVAVAAAHDAFDQILAALELGLGNS